MRKNLRYLDELVIYIKKNLKKGYTKESLKWALIGQGHSKLEIEKAFTEAEQELAREAPILKTKPVIRREIITKEGIEYASQNPERSKKSFWKKLFG